MEPGPAPPSVRFDQYGPGYPRYWVSRVPGVTCTFCSILVFERRERSSSGVVRRGEAEGGRTSLHVVSLNEKNAKEPGYPGTREAGYPRYPVPRVIKMKPGRYRYRRFRVPASGYPVPTNPGAISTIAPSRAHFVGFARSEAEVERGHSRQQCGEIRPAISIS